MSTKTEKPPGGVVAATKKIVIIGAGPCGLGAAWALNNKGHDDWIVLEGNDYTGGLSASFKDPQGFTWDVGGHVLFSHYREVDAIISEAMSDNLIDHIRSSFIRSCGTWVPYPFQNNLSFLPPEIQLECLLGLKNSKGGKVNNFGAWIEAVFGEGIARHFLRPYNEKVWSVPLEMMSHDWIGERVSVIDFDSILKNVILGKEDSGWGPNARFSFPATGGTGEIFRRIASRFEDRIKLKARVESIDPEKKLLRLNDGESVEYDTLISTIPLDSLIDSMINAPASIKEAARELVYNSVYVVGLGFKTPLIDEQRCWFYFPGDKSPFYRVTNFAKYSANNVPEGKTNIYTSYLCETSYSNHKKVDKKTIIDKTKEGLLEEGLIDEKVFSREATRFLLDVDRGYPVPTLERDAILKKVQPYLMDREIYSRGRFGAWRYETGNMDHSLKMGLEVVDLIIDGKNEKVWCL